MQPDLRLGGLLGIDDAAPATSLAQPSLLRCKEVLAPSVEAMLGAPSEAALTGLTPRKAPTPATGVPPRSLSPLCYCCHLRFCRMFWKSTRHRLGPSCPPSNVGWMRTPAATTHQTAVTTRVMAQQQVFAPMSAKPSPSSAKKRTAPPPIPMAFLLAADVIRRAGKDLWWRVTPDSCGKDDICVGSRQK